MKTRPPFRHRSAPLSPAIRLSLLLPALLFGAALLSACGSGGGGSTGAAAEVSALTLPSRISLSSAEGTSNSQAAMAALSAKGKPRRASRIASAGLRAYNDAGTDYTAQTKETWLEDTEALDLVNDILAVVADTGYENFVNAGPYRALVKPVGDEKQSQGGAATTATTTEELMEIVVEVTRASDSAPMIVKVWVREDEGPGGMAMLIRGYFTVTQGVSAQYPYGAMTAHFKGVSLDENGAEGDEVMTMAISIGADDNANVVVQVIDEGQEENNENLYVWDNRARIVADATLTAGSAYVYSGETDWDSGVFEEETFYFAYNPDYFKYQDSGTSEVTVLDKGDLRHKIFKYKLFDRETGAKVTRNSGFGIQLGNGQYGYVGYHGLWAPYGVSLADGDTVTRADNGLTYTLIKKGGKLTKHTRASVLLDDLDGVEISVWNNGQDLVIAWDADAGTFKKIGTRNNASGGVDYLDEADYENYAFANEWEGGWCEALGAHLALGRLTPANGDTVYYHIQETVSGSVAENLTLYYWGFALDAPITQAVINGAAAAEGAYMSGAPVRKTYTFDAAARVLKDAGGDAVLLGSGLTLTGTRYQYGYTLGPLTTDDTYDASNCWSIYDGDVYYQWSTSATDSWSQFTTVRDGAGDLVGFDRPLSFSYTHQTANDVNGDTANDGKKFRLEYDGSDLRIPWKFDEATGDWWPAINLKDGTVLTDADGGAYVVKAVEESLIMSAADPALAADLVIDTTVPAPDLAYDATKTDLVGDVPANTLLKVVKGELID